MDELTRQLARIQFESVANGEGSHRLRWMAGLVLLALDGAMCRAELDDAVYYLRRAARVEACEGEDEQRVAAFRALAASALAHLKMLATTSGEQYLHFPRIPHPLEGPSSSDGEIVRGFLGTSYGTSMYDFHQEYPIRDEEHGAVGCRKADIAVLLPDGERQPLFEYCRDHNVVVVCPHCGQVITYETESTCAPRGGRPRAPEEVPGPPPGGAPADPTFVEEEDDVAPVTTDPPRPVEDDGETTHVVLLLDRSSSMELSRAAAVEGVNRKLARLREAASARDALSVLVTIVGFGGTLELVRFARPADEIDNITLEEYRCGIGTRLLDAFNFAFDLLAEHVRDRNDLSYELLAVSDGEEDASVNATWRRVATRIDRRRRTGRWSFAYLGATGCAAETAGRLGLAPQ
ncbi:MAG: vWA domain-containing protein [Polyangia bacterium]